MVPYDKSYREALRPHYMISMIKLLTTLPLFDSHITTSTTTTATTRSTSTTTRTRSTMSTTVRIKSITHPSSKPTHTVSRIRAKPVADTNTSDPAPVKGGGGGGGGKPVVDTNTSDPAPVKGGGGGGGGKPVVDTNTSDPAPVKGGGGGGGGKPVVDTNTSDPAPVKGGGGGKPVVDTNTSDPAPVKGGGGGKPVVDTNTSDPAPVKGGGGTSKPPNPNSPNYVTTTPTPTTTTTPTPVPVTTPTPVPVTTPTPVPVTTPTPVPVTTPTPVPITPPTTTPIHEPGPLIKVELALSVTQAEFYAVSQAMMDVLAAVVGVPSSFVTIDYIRLAGSRRRRLLQTPPDILVGFDIDTPSETTPEELASMESSLTTETISTAISADTTLSSTLPDGVGVSSVQDMAPPNPFICAW
ncbi:hypothetical protein T484DRAFT_1753476 [Baffinella frigidus]|nr:hypothetical protein T484DRAFT_1753476 [Cryptophyta sp. CCMP2293]